MFRLDVLADRLPAAPGLDYDEIPTLARNLCRNVDHASKGVRGGDLSAQSRDARDGLGELFCPSDGQWGGGSGMILNRVAPIASGLNSGLLRSPDLELMRVAAEFLADPAVFDGRTPPFRNSLPPPPILPTALPAGCTVDVGVRVWMYEAPPPACIPTPTRGCP